MENIVHEKLASRGAFEYHQDGKKMAEMVYMMQGDHKMIIDHTEVDESLSGKGVGKKLLEQLVLYVREHQIKVVPVCPFAHATFRRVKEWQDVLV